MAQSVLLFYAAHAGGLTVAWCSHMAERHPCLIGVLRTMLDELKLGEPWDVCRVEEVDSNAHLEHAEHARFPNRPPTVQMPNAHRQSPTAQANIVPIDPNRRLDPGMLRLVEAPRWGYDSGGRRLRQCVSPRLL